MGSHCVFHDQPRNVTHHCVITLCGGSSALGSPMCRLHAVHAVIRKRGSSPVTRLPRMWCTVITPTLPLHEGAQRSSESHGSADVIRAGLYVPTITSATRHRPLSSRITCARMRRHAVVLPPLPHPF